MQKISLFEQLIEPLILIAVGIVIFSKSGVFVLLPLWGPLILTFPFLLLALPFLNAKKYYIWLYRLTWGYLFYGCNFYVAAGAPYMRNSQVLNFSGRHANLTIIALFWAGAFFALAFAIQLKVVRKFYKKDEKKEEFLRGISYLFLSGGACLLSILAATQVFQKLT